MKSHKRKDDDRKPSNFVFTDRDKRILEHIYVHDGMLTDHQVKELEFTGHRQAQDRLGKLFHNGYVSRPSPEERKKQGVMFYWLTEKGAVEVAGTLGKPVKDITWRDNPNWGQIEHDVRVNDIRIIVSKACQENPEFSLFEWMPESLFRSDPDTVKYKNRRGEPKKRQVIPDGYFVIDRENAKFFRSRLLLELDMSTHSNTAFAEEKVRAGLAYMKSNVYAKRFGSKSGRWLIVVKGRNGASGKKRLKYLREKTFQTVGEEYARVFYFALYDEITIETVLTEAIWYRGNEVDPRPLFPKKQ